MKKIIAITLIFLIALCLKAAAQQPGDSKPMASRSSFKGRHELRREKRVQHNSRNLTQKNERIAKSNQKDGLMRVYGIHRNKPKKEKKGSEPKESAEPKVATDKIKTKD